VILGNDLFKAYDRVVFDFSRLKMHVWK